MNQPPLFEDVSIRNARLEQLLAIESLLLGLLRRHFDDGRIVRPLVKILDNAIAAGCRDWDDVLSFAQVPRNGSKQSRERLLQWIDRCSRQAERDAEEGARRERLERYEP